MIWTEQERSYVLSRIGSQKTSTIAKSLGRSERSVRRVVGNTQETLIKDEGMGITEFTREFGVNDKTVLSWIKRGHIKAVRRVIERRRVYAFSYDAVTDFLRDYGYALSPVINPRSYIWRDIVTEIRSELEAMVISSSDIIAALHLAKPNLALLRRKHGFPSPQFRLGSRAGGDWYNRQDVAEWIRAHPRYIIHPTLEKRKQ